MTETANGQGKFSTNGGFPLSRDIFSTWQNAHPTDVSPGSAVRKIPSCIDGPIYGIFHCRVLTTGEYIIHPINIPVLYFNHENPVETSLNLMISAFSLGEIHEIPHFGNT